MNQYLLNLFTLVQPKLYGRFARKETVYSGEQRKYARKQYIIQHMHSNSLFTTCFDTEVPSSGSHYNKGVEANMPTVMTF
jgi:hypothetical protein